MSSGMGEEMVAHLVGGDGKDGVTLVGGGQGSRVHLAGEGRGIF